MIPNPAQSGRGARRGGAGGRRTLQALLVVALAVVAACTTDGDTPLGRDIGDDVLGARAGEVIADSFRVTGDTVVVVPSMLDGVDTLFVGLRRGYRYAAIIVPDFSGASSAGLTKAELRTPVIAGSPSIPVTIHPVTTAWREGQNLSSLDTLAALPDDQGRLVRTLSEATQRVTLPVDVVRAWIDGDSSFAGVAIVYADTAREALLALPTRSADIPTQIVTNSTVFHPTSDDGTFVEAAGPDSGRVVSTGYVRYLHVDLPLDSLPDSVMVNTAVVRLHVVPGSITPGGGLLEMFVPDDTDPAAPGFRTGPAVTAVGVFDTTRTVDFPVTLTLRAMLQGDIRRNGLNIRLGGERTAVRQAAFYGSDAAPTRRPMLRLVATQPVRFSP